jgi:hypothetical protein
MFNVDKSVLALLALIVAPACVAADISERSLRAADAEQMRIIVEADARAQRSFMHENYIINSPANRILRKSDVVEMLAQGKMASERFERVIEETAITGNVGVVMGSEIVRPAAGSELRERHGNKELKRRFTNVFIFENGAWHFLARQASIVELPCK